MQSQRALSVHAKQVVLCARALQLAVSCDDEEFTLASLSALERSIKRMEYIKRTFNRTSDGE